MCRSASVLLLLALYVFAQFERAVCADVPDAEKEVCGFKQILVEATIRGWLAAFEKCPLDKGCEIEQHKTQFEQISLRCSLASKSKQTAAAAAASGATGLKELLPNIEAAMHNLKAMFEPTKADLAKLDKLFDQQVRAAWNEVAALQSAVFRSTLASGRTERAVLYSFLEGDSNPRLDGHFQPSNVQELLTYAWALPLKTLQRNVYGTVEKLVHSSSDPLLQTLYTVDVGNVDNAVLGSREHLLNDHVQQLRDRLATNSFETLVSFARRFPERFAHLTARLFKLPDGTKPSAGTLPAVVNFIGQLPTAEQRFRAVDALLQTLTAENGTLVADAEYVYPLAALAHAMQPLVDTAKKSPDADHLRDRFNTPVDGKSAQYYTQLLTNPSSAVAASK
ncbi:uncharacterized protein LOC128717853 [Anopheles marshallii]|uniref:uncharacterized protein LOC128717853 n=1 Tax=Anopheles marshallii TaxID=1521116 RepID=UPI00237B1E26|nr:uncharacterized protein LOC128717853 [Anopheles marshallii]